MKINEEKGLNLLNLQFKLLNEQEKQKFYTEILLFFNENRSKLDEILTNIRNSKNIFDFTINALFKRCKIEKEAYKVQQVEIALIALLYAIYFTFNFEDLIEKLVNYTKKDVAFVIEEVNDIINWFDNTIGIDLKNFSINSFKNLKIDGLINANENINLKEKHIFMTNNDKEDDLVDSNKPLNKSVRFKITNDDNLESKLVKQLINIIYMYEAEIVEYEKTSKNKLNLSITGELNLRHFENRIVASEISKILGISLDIAKSWSYGLESSTNNFILIDIRRKTFEKIKEHIKLFSNNSKIYNAFSKVLEDYQKKKYKKDFINDLLSIFNKYIKEGGGTSWLSTLIEKSRAYIDDLENRRGEGGKGGPEHYAKYFNLLVNIYLLDNKNFILKDGLKIEDLKSECHEFIFKEMQKREMIKELGESRFSKRIVNPGNKELFDIVIYSLIAFTKIERRKGTQYDNFIFKYNDLSRKISLKNTRDFFTGKFREGYPLAKTEGRRLIKELRKGFFYAPEECYNAIYMIKIHINKTHWRAYDMHFKDLRVIQRKELLDLNLGLDVFDKEFFEDAHYFVTKDGQIIVGAYVFYLTRHHLDEDQKNYLIFEYKDNDFRFRIILLASKSHWKVHGNRDEFNRRIELLNARMKHLYRLLQYPYIQNKNYFEIFKVEFRNKIALIYDQEIEIWRDFPEEIINNWIERWIARKTFSDQEFYEKYYPNFYREHYKSLIEDINLFNAKDSNCRKPEFWYWYFTNYSKENIYPSISFQ